MSGVSEFEVLEHGAPQRRGTRRIWIAIVILAVALIAAAAIRAIVTAESGAGEFGIESVELVAVTTVDPNARGSGWPIKVGMPADADLPGAQILARVSGDPRQDVEVRSATSGGALSLEPIAPVVIPAGQSAEVPMTIAPLDCGVTDATLDEAGYRWRRATGVQVLESTEGTVVPVSEGARDELARILSDLCAPAGAAPQLTMLDARLDGPWREQVLDITVTLVDTADGAVEPERVLLHPLDGPGLRGIGTFSRPDTPPITLMWSVAPLAEDTDGVLDALVRAIAVVDGKAYPWIIRIVPPAALRSATPLRTEADG